MNATVYVSTKKTVLGSRAPRAESPNMVPMRKPLHCRRRAHERFRAQLDDLDAPGALLRAAVAISMHEITDAEPAAVEARIDEYAARVRERVKTREARAYLAHLHAVLFDE